jgi:signal transduction histidine kinase
MTAWAAYITWFAVVLSEWQSQKDQTRLAFMFCALVFVVALVIELRRANTQQRGWSIALLLQCLSAVAAVVLGGFGITPALYVILGGQLFERLPRAQFWMVLVAINAVLFYRLSLGTNWVWAISGLAAYGGFQIFGLMMTANTLALQRANTELESANAELLSTRVLLGESSRSDERLRLSRELHDVCGHKLTALKLTLRAASGQGELRGEGLQLVHQLADELLSDIRSVVSQLRLHDGVDLPSALTKLAEHWRMPRVQLDLQANLKVPSVEIAEALLRVAQESITNAARHGKATLVKLSLRMDQQSLLLDIADNGEAKLPLAKGNGILGMQERVDALHSQLRFAAHRPSGLLVSVRVPLSIDNSAMIGS